MSEDDNALNGDEPISRIDLNLNSVGFRGVDIDEIDTNGKDADLSSFE